MNLIKLTKLQLKVLHEIKSGAIYPKDYPRNYEAGSKELEVAKDLAKLNLIEHSSVKPKRWLAGFWRHESPCGWHLTALGLKQTF